MAFQMPPRNPYGQPSTAIEATPAYLQQLHSTTHTKDVLLRNGFITTTLSAVDIDDKKRCRRCHARMSNNKNRLRSECKDAQESSASRPKLPSEGASTSGRTNVEAKDGNGDQATKPPKQALKCQYHTGRIIRMQWTCCRTFASAPGCTFAPEHEARLYNEQELVTRHQFHRTPPSTLLDLSPPPLISILDNHYHDLSGRTRQPRQAVAIDCEMGVAYDGESVLIRVSVVDYFTSEILLDSLVYPDVKMLHYNTRYSGVSRKDMEDARNKGKCLIGGLAAAREEVWKWVGPETVVVGHAVNNDLASLRWIHPLIIDSLILAAAEKAAQEKLAEELMKKEEEAALLAAAKAREQSNDLMTFSDAEGSDKGSDGETKTKTQRSKRGKLSLKALTREILGRNIQVGKAGHDSLEDALAARDLVHWFIMQRCNLLMVQQQHQQSIMGFW
ncbi:RNA exonuclease 3 [Colletotrichum trifolii]|uniref:RNA exonuclease 3 n=1 Tax=Colletotrichum trifolii TaxID=5466 RepID=A0A4R8QNS9_COLTR|nr:RNA exonuclease 3 [Colletotrichum trifolii]